MCLQDNCLNADQARYWWAGCNVGSQLQSAGMKQGQREAADVTMYDMQLMQ
jgi:hypothetical protein